MSEQTPPKNDPQQVAEAVRDGMFAKTPRELLAAAGGVSPRIALAAQARRIALAQACHG